MSEKFIALWKTLNISYDDFIRTTQDRHIKAVQAILEKIYKQGDIYQGHYEGLYCVDCEAFYIEKDLENNLCPVHNKKVEKVKEESYFFKLSKYQDKILRYILENKDFIYPATRKNEIVNRIKGGLRDLSISRSTFDWGIPFPPDKSHVTFVWFDALCNYISVLDYPKKKFKKYWPADIHLIGKDILWFHAVIWPAILLAAGIELPRKIVVHGFINVGGEKISKSKGVAIDPLDLVDKYGADALRYFLLREISFGQDGDFSQAALVRRFNSDLANDLGNLLHRSLTMCEKYFQGKVPAPGTAADLDKRLLTKAKALPGKYNQAMQRFEFAQALEAIWDLINTANKYIEEAQPWTLFKEKNTPRLSSLIYNLLETLRITAVAISPVMPQTAKKVFAQLGLKMNLDKVRFDDLLKWGGIPPKLKINKGNPLFPRIE